ncbi:NmrA/HSCARG family protein [Actinoplanes utahensis]|uniref:Nucleoside-diphosphate sugar epimerase n=1 Tax=Actinoplanes utahensis TaxID=1869 RepID=A0A0A6XGL8_ACTUT|nr:NmrA/HSCARG family protein [Actinoplanes utahensis]KHD79237.1 nucleoside-diphosphate sugar epimerase [Actinoplanes utahensis]GIF30341.1 nucleotide-diphosphate-sugar epimerase [Actinoplanes utahensis]
MSQQKIIAVVGATGSQGGGLVEAILADPSGEYAVRALTRDTTSPRAQELVKLGAEVVQADNYDAGSLERAFTGAYGAFLVTDFWAHMSAERELEEAADLAGAAKRTGLRHVIWSTLEDTRDHIPVDDDRMPTLQGRYKVPHFDAKAEADGLFRAAGVPTTFLRTTFYWENLANGWGATRDADGVLTLSLPMGGSRLAGIAVADIGRTAYGIFRAGDEYVGRTVHIAGEHLTGEQIAAGLSRAVGEPVVYRPLSHDAYRGLGFPGADEAGNMLQYYTEFADYFTGVRDLAEVRRLNPGLQTFDEWLAANGHTIPTA